MSIAAWLASPRIRRGIAASAVVLATGGLVLFRAPAAGAVGQPLMTNPTGNVASFSGQGAHGTVSLSHTAVLSGGERDVYAEVSLHADRSGREQERAPLALAVVLDTSGSMYGEKIDQAKNAVLALVRDMRDDDEIAVIRYSDDATVVQPLARLGEVREEVNQRVRHIEAEGGTAIPRGLSSGLHALEEAGTGRVDRVVLVSDGLDSSRPESTRMAKEAFEKGVTVSTLGIGLDFDEAYMSGVSQAGHGNFGFVKDAPALAGFLHRELDEAAATTIEDARVRLHLAPGVRFVSASGADARVIDDDEVELRLGALFAGDERRAIVHVTARLGDGERAPLGGHALWTVVGDARGSQDVAFGGLAIAGTIDPKVVAEGRDGAVLASATSVIASQRELEAAEAYAKGDVTRAQGLIDQNIADLGAVAADAPAPAAAALVNQQKTYAATKHRFRAAPGSLAGRAAAKRAYEIDSSNLARKAF